MVKEQEQKIHEGDEMIKVVGTGTVDKLSGQRCRNESYRRSFILRYSDSYRDEKGDLVYVNMYQNVEGFNEVARKMKEILYDGAEVMVIGSLKSRETEHCTIHFILVEHPEDIRII